MRFWHKILMWCDIHHNQVGCACCMESTHTMMECPRVCFCFLDAFLYYFTKKPANSGTTIREVEAGLINRYHMRPVLIVPVLMPVCPHEVAVTMIQCSSEAYDWALERYPAANKGVWTIQTETWRPLHLILHTEGNVFPLIIWGGAQPFLGEVILNWYLCSRRVVSLALQSRRRTLGRATFDHPVFLDICVREIPSPDKSTISSNTPGQILAGMIVILFWEHTSACGPNKWHTSFG